MQKVEGSSPFSRFLPPLGFPSLPAPWRSGYAAACKAVYTGSIPVGAFSTLASDIPFARAV